MRDNSYTVLKRWMATELHLAGNELIIFAVLYGYTVNGRGYYSGLSDLTLWTGITERGVIKVINRLVDMGYVERCSSVDGRSTTTYRTIIGGEQSSCGSEQSSYRGEQSSSTHEQSSPNNKDNIDNINNTIVQSADADVDESVSKPSVRQLSDEFAEVWKLYPRKEGKTNSLKAYVKARQEGVSRDTIVRGIQAYTAYLKREHTDVHYIKMGSTWFHQRCWEDDYGITQSPQTAPTEQDEAIYRLVYERQQARKAAQNETAE